MEEIIYKLQEDGIYYPVISFEQETNYAVGKYGLIIGEYIMTHKRHEYITRINEINMRAEHMVLSKLLEEL